MKDRAYSFAQKVDRQLEELSSSDFHRRIGRSKKLREELHPISRLGLYFKGPGLEVEVEAFENSGVADGHIHVSGYWEDEFDVQVTYHHNYEDSLRDELLATQGFAPGAGNIYRDKTTKQIVATGAAVDHDAYFDQISDAILALFRQKTKLAYGPKTMLIIAFDEIKLKGLAQWSRLLNCLEDRGGLTASDFSEVFLFNCASSEMQRAT
jgi:hypothetical protein